MYYIGFIPFLVCLFCWDKKGGKGTLPGMAPLPSPFFIYLHVPIAMIIGGKKK